MIVVKAGYADETFFSGRSHHRRVSGDCKLWLIGLSPLADP